MPRFFTTFIICIVVALSAAVQNSRADFPDAVSNPDKSVISHTLLPALQETCAGCHGEEKQKAKFALHDIDPDISSGKDVERWEKILEMVSIGDMPPEDEPQLTDAQRKQLIDLVTAELRKLGRGPSVADQAFPNNGNRLDHESLFSGEHKGPAFTSSRLWRISPHIYYQWATDIDMARKLSAPLQEASSESIRDYSLLYADEATINTMLRNSKRAAATLLQGTIKHTKNRSSTVESKQGGRTGTRHLAFQEYLEGEGTPTAEEMEKVLAFSIDLLLQRESNDADHERYIAGFLRENTALAGREAGLQGMLCAIMLSPEFLFRMELGLGEVLPDGRRMLSPREIAYALSYTLFDYVEPKTLKAAAEGNLSTREDVEREFRRMLDEPDKKVRGAVNKKFWVVAKGSGPNPVHGEHPSFPRLLRFFREFFGYQKVQEIFKDDTRHDGKHDPFMLVSDADWFVLRALKDDRQVLKQLLTGDEFYIKFRTQKPVKDAQPYNLDSPDPPIEENPIKMPGGQRSGILTHPAWLAAYSGNFENDPVRRGRWIQEHLLAGIVPDIPIGVQAQLPEEPHHTLRQRFEVVNKEECWRCHKKMNPLGNPFEAYDDFGRYRDHHFVDGDGNVIASEFEAHSRLRKTEWRNSQKKGAADETFSMLPVDTSGVLNGTGDPELDGEVSGPIDLLDRLSRSDRVRQSFIRHVFRYWMGRNETLNDSPTLMAMDKAYVENDGSFRELLVALVTSDSFLYRR